MSATNSRRRLTVSLQSQEELADILKASQLVNDRYMLCEWVDACNSVQWCVGNHDIAARMFLVGGLFDRVFVVLSVNIY